jgi:hypothetical protein
LKSRSRTSSSASATALAQDPTARRRARTPADKSDAEAPIFTMRPALGNQSTQQRTSKGPCIARCPTGGACDECLHARGRAVASSSQDDAERDVSRPGLPDLQTATGEQRETDATSAGGSVDFEQRETAPSLFGEKPEFAPPVSSSVGTASSAESEVAGESATEPVHVSGVIVSDSATSVDSGQMRKEDFLATLRQRVEAAVDEALADIGRSTADCPYIDYWFAFYAMQDPERIERTARRYAPEAAGVQTARELIDLIVRHARRAADIWVATGRITGVPGGIPIEPFEGRSAARASRILRKAGPRSPGPTDDPDMVRSQLYGGRPLEANVRARMERAFGGSFADVRVHDDANAATLSSSLGARAFTVATDVAFGTAEYRPGTIVGDALIAHELAHVLQQRAATDTGSAMSSTSGVQALEGEADAAAAHVLSGRLANVAPRGPLAILKAGLSLQRCKRETGGCVTGNLTARTNGALQGGWTVNDYLSGGMSWGAVAAPGSAGRDGTGFKVQVVGPFSGSETLGVSQTMTHGNSNQSFLDGTAAYLGRAAGTLRNGDVNPEPVLDAGDPFASRPWFLRYRDGMASFADVPRAGAGDQGHIDFNTCFHSSGSGCSHRACCVVWRWTVDFTGANSVNTVTQQSQRCR